MRQGACAGGIAVVIDVLRASTTIITALAHGAARVRPVLTVEEARAEAAARGAMLGGERGGRRIEGFDLGNSPLEYGRDRVGGRPIVITTTNGTAALHACDGAAEVLIGAIVNRSAVAEAAHALAIEHGGCDIHLVCAGTEGAVTEEDLLAAGAILDAAVHRDGCSEDSLDATGREALCRFRAAVAAGPTTAQAIAREFASSIGGRNLIELGMEADLPASAAIDSLSVVPRLGVHGQLHDATFAF
ncbi:MAG: 2-phosphosulfolactate phosphatase [Planctomycetia bacterium]